MDLLENKNNINQNNSENTNNTNTNTSTNTNTHITTITNSNQDIDTELENNLKTKKSKLNKPIIPEYYCSLCEGNNDILISCIGYCKRYFHKQCILIYQRNVNLLYKSNHDSYPIVSNMILNAKQSNKEIDNLNNDKISSMEMDTTDTYNNEVLKMVNFINHNAISLKESFLSQISPIQMTNSMVMDSNPDLNFKCYDCTHSLVFFYYLYFVIF